MGRSSTGSCSFVRASVESPETMASERELDDAHGWFTWLPPMAPRLPVGGQPP